MSDTPQDLSSIVQAEVDLTNERFLAAIEIIETQFGVDYAKKNPQLLAAVLATLANAAK